jgi:hypothetical protein
MAQQVAAREQLNQLLGVMLATLLDEFAKARWVADGSTILLEIAREHAIDDRADGEAAADGQPSGADAKAEMVKLDRLLKASSIARALISPPEAKARMKPSSRLDIGT